jgi:hypothetical protein
MNFEKHIGKISCQIFIKIDKNMARYLSILKIILPENYQNRKYSCNIFVNL